MTPRYRVATTTCLRRGDGGLALPRTFAMRRLMTRMRAEARMDA